MGDGCGRVNPAPRRTAARFGVSECSKNYIFFLDIFFFDIFAALAGV
jgi:hypothetical protein